MTLIKLYWHILAEVRAFGGLSDYDTLSLRYHNPPHTAESTVTKANDNHRDTLDDDTSANAKNLADVHTYGCTAAREARQGSQLRDKNSTQHVHAW